VSRKRGDHGEGRARLIGAAAACFGRGGPRAMTIHQVCAQANASVGTVYRHFPGGIPDIEDALYLDTLASYQRALLAELRGHSSAAAGVKSVVSFHLNWIAENLSLAQYLSSFSASMLSSEHLAQLDAMNAEFADAVIEWREPHVSSGHMRRLPVMLYWSIILGPAQQYGAEIVSKLAVEEAAAAVRSAGPIFADSAWLAVKGERG
jgi:AcrR family transcriptional regulator